jgi:hypothetical protein
LNWSELPRSIEYLIRVERVKNVEAKKTLEGGSGEEGHSRVESERGDEIRRRFETVNGVERGGIGEWKNATDGTSKLEN